MLPPRRPIFGGYNLALGNVNGNNEFSNQYNMDGGIATNLLKSLPVEFISMDSIEEFKVETANYSAEVGMHAGGIVNIATKHGTNSIHGGLWEFFQNDKLSARNFFALGKPPLRYNLYGGNLGGRIIKDKLFFFASYEGNRNSTPETFISQVPTAAERQGDFTPGTGAKNAVPYDPFSLSANGNRIPFPNDEIPKSLWNPVTQQYLSYWPQANTPGIPNFIYNGASKNNFDRYSGRIDYNISSNDIIFGRFGYQNNPTYSPGQIPGGGNALVGDTYNGRDMVVTWNHIFGATRLNQARFSFSNGYDQQHQSDFQGQNIAKQLGLPFANELGPSSLGCPDIGFPSGTITVGTCDANQNSTFPARTYSFTDDYTFRHGNHNFKTGFLTIRYLEDSDWGRPGGTEFDFNGNYTSQINDF